MDKGKTRMSDQIGPNKIGKVEVNKHDNTNQTVERGHHTEVGASSEWLQNEAWYQTKVPTAVRQTTTGT